MTGRHAPRYSPLDRGGHGDPECSQVGATTEPQTFPGPDTVPGVQELRARGFTPVEECTGAAWVAQVWPEDLRASVIETRHEWLDDPDWDGRLWMLRSPWPGFDLMTALSVLWSWAEQDRVAALDEAFHRRRVVEALSWDHDRAMLWAKAKGLRR